MLEEIDSEEELPYDAKQMWPFSNTQDYLAYEKLRTDGYLCLRQSHELFQKAYKGKK